MAKRIVKSIKEQPSKLKKSIRMKKKVTSQQPPCLNVLLYKFNRQVCDSYKIYVKNVKLNQWYLVTIVAGKYGLEWDTAPMPDVPPKEYVKLK